MAGCHVSPHRPVREFHRGIGGFRHVGRHGAGDALESVAVQLGETRISQLLNIFLEPGKVFVELKEKPTFLLPTLVVVILLFVALTAYFVQVDPAW